MYNVLIVDDEIDMVDTLKMEVELLFPDNVKVTTAYDGQDSLEKSSHNQFDLVITDFKMPKKNGVEFITAMKASEELPNFTTPVIFISAFIPDVKDILQLRENTIFVDKPYDPKSLRRNIKILMGCEDKA